MEEIDVVSHRLWTVRSMARTGTRASDSRRSMKMSSTTAQRRQTQLRIACRSRSRRCSPTSPRTIRRLLAHFRYAISAHSRWQRKWRVSLDCRIRSGSSISPMRDIVWVEQFEEEEKSYPIILQFTSRLSVRIWNIMCVNFHIGLLCCSTSPANRPLNSCANESWRKSN